MRIGLSQRILWHNGRAYDSIEHGWYSYLKGHTLFYLPNSTAQDFEHIADNLDSFIITGGDDSTIRRTTETRLAAAMTKRRKPVVGICHGAFMLTHMLGGEVVDVDAHYEQLHPVMYFGDVKIVNSFHTIAIKTLHNSGTVLCTDELGHTEAWIDGNLAGVVWHPERMSNPWLPDEIEDLIFKENK